MSAARAERRPGSIPNRQWPSAAYLGVHRLVVNGTEPGDQEVHIGIRVDGVTAAGLDLTADQLRELAADLVERAELLDNVPARNRRTPNWHIREGEKRLGTARHFLNHGMDPQVAAAEATVAAAHFQAAQAKQTHTHVHIATESGTDDT